VQVVLSITDSTEAMLIDVVVCVIGTSAFAQVQMAAVPYEAVTAAAFGFGTSRTAWKCLDPSAKASWTREAV